MAAPTSAKTIPERMRAVRCHGPGDYRLEWIPTPVPGPNEVLIQVEACGVCASDVKCFSGAPLFWGDANRPRYVEPPVTPGHEFVGRVVSLGEGAAEHHGVAMGDRVLSEQIVPCRRCRQCREGRYHLCEENLVYGFRQRCHGAMAEYMLFPATAIVHKVPEHLTTEEAVLIEPLACSLHAVDRAAIQLGDTVVVAGCGTLGLGMVAFAALRGPRLLIAVDRYPSRRAVAERLGAQRTFSPENGEAEKAVLELTDGLGCDVYMEATGHPEAVNQGLRMLRKGGTFVEFSVMARETCTDWTIIGDGKELTIYGSHLGPYCYPRVIEMLSRRALDVRDIVTHRMPLEQYEQAFELVHSGEKSIKVLLTP